MRENLIRTRWSRGEAAVNGWATIPSPWSAEIMANLGWDSVTVDAQHGLMDYDVALSMLQAISTTPTAPMVRVPWNEPGIIMKMLDAGSYGVICPMINTREEAEAFVGACRYPPRGYRSYGPLRASLYAGSDYLEHANETIVTLAMIETAEAVKNAEAICSTPGLDGIYIGPSDLSISLGGKPGTPVAEPFLAEPIAKVLAATKKCGVVAGIHCSSTGEALQVIEQGFRFVTVLSDSRYLSMAAQAAVDTMMKGRGTRASGQPGPY